MSHLCIISLGRFNRLFLLLCLLCMNVPGHGQAQSVGYLGDLDRDNSITVLDLVRLINFLNEEAASLTSVEDEIAASPPNAPVPAVLADVNGDGFFNTQDVDALADVILGVVVPATLPPLRIRETSPTAGESGVAVTRETVFPFNYPLASTTLLSGEQVYASFGGRRLLARPELSSDHRTLTLFYAEPLPGSARVRVTLDAPDLSDFLGRPADLDADGQPGGQAIIDFDTLSLTPVPRTAVRGTVFASEPVAVGVNEGTGTTNFVNRPLAGVTITVDGMEETMRVVTDASGEFLLHPVPAGEFFVHIDGRTAVDPGREIRYPDQSYYPFVGKTWHGTAGRTNYAGYMSGSTNQASTNGWVYLPLIRQGTLQPVSSMTDTVITFPTAVVEDNPALAGVAITVPANGLFGSSGVRGGRVGIAPVPPDRLPGVLPPGLEFPLVITVQTDGGENFDRPVPVRFPNLPDPVTGERLPPGAKTALWSFDHDTGQWEMQGPMTVTADGLFVESDPGVGIRQPGWHGWFDCPTCCPLLPPFEKLSLWNLADAALACASDFIKIRKGLRCLADLVDLSRSCANLVRNLLNALESKDPGRCTLVRATVLELKRLKELIGLNLDCFQETNPVGRAEAAVSCLKRLIDLARSVCGRTTEVEGKRCEPSYLTRLLCVGLDLLSDLLSIAKQYLKQSSDLLKKLVNVALDTTIVAAESYLRNFCSASPPPVGLAETLTEDDLLQALRAVQGPLEELAGAASVLHESELLLDTVHSRLEVFLGLESRARRSVGNRAYWAASFGGRVLRGSGREGNLTLPVIPRNTSIRWAEYYPDARLYGESIGRVPSDGFYPLSVSEVSLDEKLHDTDLDGLSDAAESVIGTNPSVGDSDSDGIQDGAEVEQGTDPLDGLPVVTGVIATADTPGKAIDVCALNDLVIVADYHAGVTVFSAVNGQNPIRIAQVDTPGTAMAVSCSGNLIAVADGDAGLQIIDITDPPAARILHQISKVILGGPAEAVAATADIAFVGTLEGAVNMVQMTTGTVLQGVQIDNAPVTDLAIEGTVLYAYTGTKLFILRFSGSGMVLAGSITTPGGVLTGLERPRLFVGDSLAYAVDSRGFFNWGYRTISVSDPTAPTLLSATSTRQFGWRQIVPNGSGLSLAAVGIDLGESATDDIHLYDTRNPSASGTLLTVLETPGSARAVSIYNGLAYVADGEAGLAVINYLPYDNLGRPPGITFTIAATNNTTAAGSLLHLRATVSDDVQVRKVDFFLNGQLLTADGNFPFETLYRVPPNGVGDRLEFRALASDTGGNSAGMTNPPILVTPDVAPRSVVVNSPINGAVVVVNDDVDVDMTILDETSVDFSTLEILVDAVSVPKKRAALGRWIFVASQVPGSHALQVRVRDFAGNLGQSAPVTFRIVKEAISREITVLALSPDPGKLEAISREVTALVADRAAGSLETSSREVTALVLDRSSAAKEAISRELTVKVTNQVAAPAPVSESAGGGR